MRRLENPLATFPRHSHSFFSMNLRALLAIAVLPAIHTFAASPSTPAADLKVAAGFKVELLKSATDREGSWVSMAVDAKGRLYISPQAKAPDGGIMRLTLDAAGQVAKTEWLKPDVSAAMGMLWAFDSLYVSGQGPDGQAIYRLRDADGDDDLDQITLLKKVPGGGGEHGAHALVLGPDDKIYMTHGNSTPLIDGIDPQSPYRNYAEDVLVPRVLDPVATFFDNLKVPYGHILRTDENGAKWELFAGDFAMPTTSTSMKPASFSPTTATWNGTPACRGTGPRACSTSCPAVSMDSAREIRNGR